MHKKKNTKQTGEYICLLMRNVNNVRSWKYPWAVPKKRVDHQAIFNMWFNIHIGMAKNARISFGFTSRLVVAVWRLQLRRDAMRLFAKRSSNYRTEHFLSIVWTRQWNDGNVVTAWSYIFNCHFTLSISILDLCGSQPSYALRRRQSYGALLESHKSIHSVCGATWLL